MGATKLENLKIDSVDLVDQGANPDAFIRLFKRGEKPETDPDEGLFRKFVGWLAKGLTKGAELPTELPTDVENSPMAKEKPQTFTDNLDRERLQRVIGEMSDYCYALSDSFSSILCDKELTPEKKKSTFLTSLDEFTNAVQTAAAYWAEGKSARDADDTETGIQKSAAQQTALNKLLDSYGLGGDQPPQETSTPEKEDEMGIDKSKMTPEDQAIFEQLEKKYGGNGGDTAGQNQGGDGNKPEEDAKKSMTPPDTAAAPATATQDAPADLHPAVQKALAEFQEMTKRKEAEMEELKKSLEIERLTNVAKKYEILGKKADELAGKLYELKKAGGTVYDDYVALLDENLDAVTKGGIFTEIGKNTSGSAGTEQTLGIKAAEIAKAATSGMTSQEAIIKAFEENPELAAQYEVEYMRR